MAFGPEERKTLALIASLYLVRMLGLFMVLPVLSLFGENLYGATPFLVGMALGIYGLTQAIFQIPFGWASDRFGRKPMLLLGFALFVIGGLICAASDSIYVLLLGRAVQGAGAVSAVLLALLADKTTDQQRTTAMAIVGATIGVSFGLAVILGPAVANAVGLSGLFIFTSVLGLLAFGMVLFAVTGAGRPSRVSQKGSVVAIMKDVSLLRLDISIFSLHFLQMCIWVAVPAILLNQLTVPLENHWLIYLATVGGGFVLMLPYMRKADKRGQVEHAMRVAISVLAISLLCLSFSWSKWLFFGGLLAFFWAFNLLEATLPSALTRAVDPSVKGTASGVYSTCQFLGAFLGGTFGGWLVGFPNSAVIFYFSACFAVFWLCLMIFSGNSRPKEATPS